MRKNRESGLAWRRAIMSFRERTHNASVVVRISHRRDAGSDAYHAHAAPPGPGGRRDAGGWDTGPGPAPVGGLGLRLRRRVDLDDGCAADSAACRAAGSESTACRLLSDLRALW